MTIDRLRKKNAKLLRRGNEAASRGDMEQAEVCYRAYIEKAPDDPQCLFNLAVLAHTRLKAEKDFQAAHALRVAAMEYYARAILSPEVDLETKANALNNSGLLLLHLGHPEKAKISFHLALQICPEHRAARLNFADVLVHDGDFDAADREFFEVINSDPNSAGAQFSRSMILLLMGDIRRGFREYRARFRVPSFPSKIMQTEKPMWQGEDLSGRTLIITLEQGFGDHIQFIRYAGEIKRKWPASRILFSVGDSMHALMAGCVGLDGCVPDHLTSEFAAANLEFDFHAPLLHLPDILGTTLETIPARCPYILPHPDWPSFDLPTKPGFDRDGIEHDDCKRIGLVWAGSPMHGKDRFRSIEPELFQPLIDSAPDCQFYALQCGPRAGEAERLRGIIDLAPHISEWTDTAQALLKLDLLISVDTACVHLAGALDRNVWMLTPFSPDWRWMLGCEDSPWYPRLRLFRQPERGDWATPLARTASELQKL